MSSKAISAIMVSLLVLGTLALAVNIQPVRASGAIYINPDGTITPPTAPISTVDGIKYALTGSVNDSIIVQRGNIMVDGSGYVIQGPGSGFGNGVFLSFVSNVTIRNAEVMGFDCGIYLTSSDNTVLGSNVTGNNVGIGLEVSHNTLSNNSITGNSVGISSNSSFSNTISGNNISQNHDGLILAYCSGNVFYHNNFINNTRQATLYGSSPNSWDDGYPSGGNYWTGYEGVDTHSGPGQNVSGSDKIGDQPYIIDANNTDRYPLMLPYGASAPYFRVEPQLVTMGPELAVGKEFSVTLKLYNVASDNVPYGVLGVAVGFQWNNTLIEPTAFDDRLGQPGGVLVGAVLNGLVPGFYDESGNLILSPPYTNATNFRLLGVSLSTGWWGNGTVAVITFKVVYQPTLPEPSASCSLRFIPGTGPGETDLAEYTGSVAQEVAFDVENGSYTILAPPQDTTPPITTLTIGEPKYVDPVSNITYVTQYPPFTLEAYDNESGVSYTAYHIYNSTYDGGWQNYTTQFVLDPLEDGNYTIEFYTVAKAGNVEATNSMNVTLHWFYGDINHDGKVSLSDLSLIAAAYGSRPGDPNWNRYADIAKPWGIIGLTDLVTVAAHYGQTFHP